MLTIDSCGRGLDGGAEQLVPPVDVLEDLGLVHRLVAATRRGLPDHVPTGLPGADVGHSALGAMGPDLDVAVWLQQLVLEPFEHATPPAVAGVVELAVGSDVVPNDRMDAVAADHQVAGGAPAVGQDHGGLTVLLLDSYDLGTHLDDALAENLDEDLLHVAAPDIAAGGAELPGDLPHGHLLDELALLVVDLGELDRLPDALRVVEPEPEQDLDCIGPQGEAGGPAGEVVVLLVHFDVDTGVLQGQGAGEPADTAADDHDAVQVRHENSSRGRSGARLYAARCRPRRRRGARRRRPFTATRGWP